MSDKHSEGCQVVIVGEGIRCELTALAKPKHTHTHTHAHTHTHTRTQDTRTHTRTQDAPMHARMQDARTHTRTHARTRTRARTHTHTRAVLTPTANKVTVGCRQTQKGTEVRILSLFTLSLFSHTRTLPPKDSTHL